MTVLNVLVAYTTLVATLALAISLLILRALVAPPPPTAAAAAHGSGAHPVGVPGGGLAVASPAPPFSARTSTSELFDTAELAGSAYLLAFLSSSCQGCRAALPAMIGYAGQSSGSQRLIAVIVGDPRRGADLEGPLAPVATVVYEADGGPIATAYRVTAFPSYLLISETGTVRAAGRSVLDLPQPQPR